MNYVEVIRADRRAARSAAQVGQAAPAAKPAAVRMAPNAEVLRCPFSRAPLVNRGLVAWRIVSRALLS
jgi:hypothetical protein